MCNLLLLNSNSANEFRIRKLKDKVILITCQSGKKTPLNKGLKNEGIIKTTSYASILFGPAGAKNK